MATSTMTLRSMSATIEPEIPQGTSSEPSLSEILAASEAAGTRNSLAAPVQGVVVGRLVAATESGEPIVDYPGNSGNQLRQARSTVALTPSDLGQSVVLMFEQGDAQRPIILGVLVSAPASAIMNPTENSNALYKARTDQERLVLTANREVVLQCGQASITLTSAGKVLLRGAYVSSRSSGVNRVKGASVQIN